MNLTLDESETMVEESGNEEESRATSRWFDKCSTGFLNQMISDAGSDELRYGEMLQDDLINSFCDKLQLACPDKIEALLAIQYLTCNLKRSDIRDIQKQITGERDVLQVLFDSQRVHYVLVHFDPTDRCVHLYDSLQQQNYRGEPRIASDVVQLIGHLFGHLFGSLIRIKADLEYERQRDVFSCGYRAMGVAIDLARGRNPAAYSYNTPAIFKFLQRVLEEPKPSWEAFESVEIGREKDYTGRYTVQTDVPNLGLASNSAHRQDPKVAAERIVMRKTLPPITENSLRFAEINEFCGKLKEAFPFYLDGCWPIQNMEHISADHFRHLISGRNPVVQLLYEKRRDHFVMVHYCAQKRMVRLYDSLAVWNKDDEPMVDDDIATTTSKMFSHLFETRLRIFVPRQFERQTTFTDSAHFALGAMLVTLNNGDPERCFYNIPGITRLVRHIWRHPRPDWHEFCLDYVTLEEEMDDEEEGPEQEQHGEEQMEVCEEEKLESGDQFPTIFDTVVRMFSGLSFFRKTDEPMDFEERKEHKAQYSERFGLGAGLQ